MLITDTSRRVIGGIIHINTDCLLSQQVPICKNIADSIAQDKVLQELPLVRQAQTRKASVCILPSTPGMPQPCLYALQDASQMAGVEAT